MLIHIIHTHVLSHIDIESHVDTLVPFSFMCLAVTRLLREVRAIFSSTTWDLQISSGLNKTTTHFPSYPHIYTHTRTHITNKITASLPMGPHFQRPSLENRDARRSCEWFFLWKYIRARCECHDLTEFLLNSIGPTDPLFQPCTTLESWVFACNSLFEYLNKMRMAFADR